MPINKTLITLPLVFITLLSSVLCSAQSKTKSGARPAKPHPVIPYNHTNLNAPPGMVYIKGGSTTIKYDQSSTDTNSLRKVSLTSFFIDKTEVTNEQYRQFINWVADSIAVVRYLKDDKYFIEVKSGSDKGSSDKGNNAKSDESANNPPPTASTVADSAKTPGDTTKTAGTIAPAVNTSDTSAGKNAGIAANNSDTSAGKSMPSDTSVVRKRIDWTKVNHNQIFNTKDADMRAKIQPMLDDNGNIKKEFFVFSYKFLKADAKNDRNYKKPKYKTVTLNVYPNENVWAEDLTNSQTDLYVENYFKAPPFNDYPVVGVNWLQANAFCYWRGLAASSYYNLPSYMKYYHLVYTLPSEAQWVYAAQGFYDLVSAPDTVAKQDSVMPTFTSADTTVTPHDSAYIARILEASKQKAPVVDTAKSAVADKNEQMKEERRAAIRGNYYIADYMKVKFVKYGGKYSKNYNPTDFGPPYIDSTVIHKDINGMLENFKQDEGEYWSDGAALTTPVMSFAPNEFGLYNMEGNVSEWVMDAYSPSVFAFVSDLNPVLLYDADSTDADAMKRKVVRGGSFISNAKSLTPFYRDLELQNISHCFIGFRCVMQAPEILYKNVSTRNHTIRGHKTKGKFSGVRLPEIR